MSVEGKSRRAFSRSGEAGDHGSEGVDVSTFVPSRSLFVAAAALTSAGIGARRSVR